MEVNIMEKLAKAIKRAAEIREDSYDHKEASKAQSSKKRFINFNDFYQISLAEACDQAAEEIGLDTRGTEPIYLLLKYNWNDALAWANRYEN